MCGIAGIISKSKKTMSPELREMMSHRGPDNTSLSSLEYQEYSLQFLHHRLSIIDLAETANQPFFDQTKRFSLVFNGEIYNYLELRQELEREGISFTTHSDTEVLLYSLIVWKKEALEKLNGMFAFVFYDSMTGELLMGRDPFGEKPFYYILEDENFYFSSEIKFILAASEKKFAINGEALRGYFSSHYLDSLPSETFFKGIKKLQSGEFLTLKLKDKIEFDFGTYYRPSKQNEITNLSEAKDKIRETVEDSLRLRLRSDVPVGLFLSGGVDSSVLAALTQKISQTSGGDVQFISIVSDDPSSDESPFISLVEKHLNKKSLRINIETKAEEFFNLLPQITWHNDEPLTSFSAVAYYKMVEAAKAQGLKVLLTGQGADEVFLGYRKFKFWNYKNKLKEGQFLSLGRDLFMEIGHSDLFGSFSVSEASRYLPWAEKSAKSKAWLSKLQDFAPQSRKTSSMESIQIDDLQRFSVPVLLHIEDRLSMAHGAEVRVPFLDKRIVQVGLDLSTDLKLKNGYSKFALRSAFEDLLPQGISWRKDKKGFSIPQERWLRTELNEQVQKVFSGDMISYEVGILNKKQNLNDYLGYREGRKGTLGYKDIFARLSFEIWLQSYSAYIKDEVC